jgi:hypothetical protein
MDTTTSQWTWGFGEPGWWRGTHADGSTLDIMVTYEIATRDHRVSVRATSLGSHLASHVFYFSSTSTDLATIMAGAIRKAEAWVATVSLVAP